MDIQPFRNLHYFFLPNTCLIVFSLRRIFSLFLFSSKISSFLFIPFDSWFFSSLTHLHTTSLINLCHLLLCVPTKGFSTSDIFFITFRIAFTYMFSCSCFIHVQCRWTYQSVTNLFLCLHFLFNSSSMEWCMDEGGWAPSSIHHSIYAAKSCHLPFDTE